MRVSTAAWEMLIPWLSRASRNRSPSSLMSLALSLLVGMTYSLVFTRNPFPGRLYHKSFRVWLRCDDSATARAAHRHREYGNCSPARPETAGGCGRNPAPECRV